MAIQRKEKRSNWPLQRRGGVDVDPINDDCDDKGCFTELSNSRRVALYNNSGQASLGKKKGSRTTQQSTTTTAQQQTTTTTTKQVTSTQQVTTSLQPTTQLTAPSTNITSVNSTPSSSSPSSTSISTPSSSSAPVSPVPSTTSTPSFTTSFSTPLSSTSSLDPSTSISPPSSSPQSSPQSSATLVPSSAPSLQGAGISTTTTIAQADTSPKSQAGPGISSVNETSSAAAGVGIAILAVEGVIILTGLWMLLSRRLKRRNEALRRNGGKNNRGRGGEDGNRSARKTARNGSGILGPFHGGSPDANARVGFPQEAVQRPYPVATNEVYRDPWAARRASIQTTGDNPFTDEKAFLQTQMNGQYEGICPLEQRSRPEVHMQTTPRSFISDEGLRTQYPYLTSMTTSRRPIPSRAR